MGLGEASDKLARKRVDGRKEGTKRWDEMV